MRGLAFIATALLSCASLPAFATETVKPDDVTRQETVSLGNNRFLIFSGTAAENKEYGYTVDLVKIEGGVPRFDPLFIEEYDAQRNAPNLSYGVAFFALNYHFDKASNTLDYTMIDRDDGTRWQFKYKLDVDIFKLQKVITQARTACAKEPCQPPPPEVVFSAATPQTPAKPVEKAAAAAAPAAATAPAATGMSKAPEPVNRAAAPTAAPADPMAVTHTLMNTDSSRTEKDAKTH